MCIRDSLLVGPNNCGKTTVLEAIDLLFSEPSPVRLGLAAMGRGAVIYSGDKQSPRTARIQLKHLFHGHNAQLSAEFTISGQSVAGDQTLRVYISNEPKNVQMAIPNARPSAGLPYLNISRTGAPDSVAIALGRSGDWSFADYEIQHDELGAIDGRLLPTDSLSRSQVTDQLSEVLLNPEEQLVLDILRLIEPSVEGIVAVDSPEIDGLVDRCGIFVKRKGQRERIPDVYKRQPLGCAESVLDLCAQLLRGTRCCQSLFNLGQHRDCMLRRTRKQQGGVKKSCHFNEPLRREAVSYTHLDVYKRQGRGGPERETGGKGRGAAG